MFPAVGAEVNLSAVGNARQQIGSSRLAANRHRGNINIVQVVGSANIKVGSH